MTKMKWIAIGMISLWLSGCASYGQANLDAPCPNYGSSCHKTSINGWKS